MGKEESSDRQSNEVRLIWFDLRGTLLPGREWVGVVLLGFGREWGIGRGGIGMVFVNVDERAEKMIMGWRGSGCGVWDVNRG